MRFLNTLILVVTLGGGCVPVVAKYAPHPDPANMAIGSALVATVYTLFDLEGHMRYVEQARLEYERIPKPTRVTEVVPEDVLDRLDRR